MKENEFTVIEGLGVETAFVYDFTSHGDFIPVNAVAFTPAVYEQDSFSLLLVREQNSFEKLLDLRNGAVICFDESSSVTAVCRIEDGRWNEKPDFSSVYAVLTVSMKDCTSLNQPDNLAERVLVSFSKGDVVRFRQGINYLHLPELAKLILRKSDASKPFLFMDNREYMTVEQKEYQLSGSLLHAQKGKAYSLRITNSDGRFEKTEEYNIDVTEENLAVKTALNPGVNYITCSILENGVRIEEAESRHIVFYKQSGSRAKETVMWVEQYVNAGTTNTVEKLEKLMKVAKNAGITAYAVDLKGVEGYCSYRKATRTHVKYMTCTPNPKKQIEMEIDFLEEFVRLAHQYGMKVYGSFNFFVEGNITTGDFAIDLPGTHPEWAEVLHAPEDGESLRSVLDTERSCALCYVNPANRKIWEFEAERVREVLDNYPVDGIVMDRTRYDNQYADFSDVTRKQFEDYLAVRGKKLTRWPEDIYSFREDKSMVTGTLYLDWLTFRSGIIRDFAMFLREIVDEYRAKQKRDIALAAYVGSWYDLYYQNGVNWGSKDFAYNEMLQFPVPELYTEEYAQTSYLDAIDFLMIGCYYETSEMIEKYATIGNVVTGCSLPVLASLSLPHLKTQEGLCTAAKACADYSDGTMIFDLCYTDWEKLTKALS